MRYNKNDNIFYRNEIQNNLPDFVFNIYTEIILSYSMYNK